MSSDSGESYGDTYSELLELEELESLLEEIQEAGVGDEGGWVRLSPELLDQLAAYNVTSYGDLINRIAAMHADLDATDLPPVPDQR